MGIKNGNYFICFINKYMLLLFKNYMDYLSRLYEREIKDFFEVAKIKMTGTTKESKKFGKFRHFSSLTSIKNGFILFKWSNSKTF